MTAAQTLAVLELSLALDHPQQPKTFCTAQRRNKWGHVTVSCSMHAGHVDQNGQPNAHVDTHTAARWEA